MTNNPSPETIYLKDYQAPAFMVESIKLHFALQPERTLVSNAMFLQRASGADTDLPLRLDGRQLELLKVILDGTVLSSDQYRVDPESLVIEKLPNEFNLEIVTAINPKSNTSLEGLYASGSMLCTQCEAHGFSRITYFLDRPDVLTRFTTTLEANTKDFPVLLSNGNLIDQGLIGEDRHFAVWQDPFKKPAYLFALVAGRLTTLKDSFTTVSGREVAIHFHVEEQNRDKCSHAIAALKKSMRWDEEEYGREYDLDLYQVVAVDDFNFGAMENKGLNIFNSKYVLAQPESATDSDYEAIEGVIAHEYLHNWTGNRITCRDWFQLSLKEGLTVFRDQEYGAQAYPGGGRRIREVRRLRSFQFPEDAGPLAHPVQPKEYVEINNFYTTTVYDKGAEIIRMLQTLIGELNFKKGMQLYFDRHDGEAVTIEDLLGAMTDACGCDLNQFRRWYDQSGTPQLRVTQAWQPQTEEFVVTITQDCPPTPGETEKLPLHLPLTIALLNPAGREQAVTLAGDLKPGPSGSRVLEIKQQKEEFRFQGCKQKPVVSLLRNFSAPIQLTSDTTMADLAFLLAHDTDPFSRWEAGQKLALGEILQLMHGSGKSEEVDDEKVSEETYSQIFGRLITKKWSASEADGAAELLLLPDEIYIGEQLEKIDPQAIYKARRSLRCTLAQRWMTELETLYKNHQAPGPYSPNPAAMAQRRLKNIALDYLTALGPEGPALKLCRRQYLAADNLTDRLAALSGLLEINGPENLPELADFYERGQHNALLKDRWFALQAATRRPETTQKVAELTRHPDFNRTNPNRVRSLLSTFTTANQSAFHQADASGYELLGREIATLDKSNPMLAARMSGAFSRWRRFSPPYSTLMRQELEKLAAASQVSRDLREIIDKSLVEI
ncbi:MAG: aminopeptidase N [Deltaproteobacteria bacterium]|nr:aminopeptidase N [Deltaproteobacteria bacterium]